MTQSSTRKSKLSRSACRGSAQSGLSGLQTRKLALRLSGVSFMASLPVPDSGVDVSMAILRARRPNKGMHQTGRGGVALRSPRPVVEARPAGDARCYADLDTWRLGQE